MTLLFLYLFIALLFSFLCSVMEAVLLSITPSFIKKKTQQGKGYAILLKRYKDNIDRPLAAILTLNTFAHTVGAAGVGAQAQIIWGNEYLSLVSAILTLIILFFSEIIPKTIGANYWMDLARFTAMVLRVLMVLLYPFVFLSQLITKVFNIRERKSVLSRADFSAMAEMAVEEGIFKDGESRIIQNIAIFDKLRVKDIMTPRTVMFAAPEDLTAAELYNAQPEIRFSRIPVYSGSIDNITGFILKDDLLIKLVEGAKEAPLGSFARKIPVVYISLSIPDLYIDLTSGNDHIALVVDEYGGTSGIVTLEDVIETILGLEIVDEMDNIEDLRIMARDKWMERARRMGINP
jgi:CBS domain containing-hemolysin-like protein